MKKSLSLLAILGLLLSMGLVSQVLANAPIYPEVPSVKLYTNNVGLTPAFDLAQFNTAPDGFFGDKATSYSITANFLGLDTLSASSFSGAASNVSQAGYSSATDGANTFSMANAGGSVSASNKAKFSTYKIYSLGKVGLSLGSSWTVTPSVYNASGVATAPSFGNPAAIIVSDTTKVTAVWDATSTKVVITSVTTSSSPVTVDVVASPVGNASTYTGVVDQDKERIYVYSNIFNNGTFTNASDTASYGPQIVAGKSSAGTQGWAASATDSNSVVATGVYQLTFDANADGVKVTPFPSNYVAMQANTWYTARMRFAASAAVPGTILDLYCFNQPLASGAGGDVGAHVILPSTGLPTVWTWLEAPVYVHTAASGYPQFQINSPGAQTVNIDEIQVVQAPPALFDISESNARGNTRYFYAGGLFGNTNSTTQWGAQVSPGGTNPSSSYPDTLGYTVDTVIGSSIAVGFTGGNGAQEGFKWTASSTGTGAGLIAIPATVGSHVGAQLSTNIGSGSLSGLNILLVAALGFTGTSQTEVIGAAEVGKVVPGTIYTSGLAYSSAYQLQIEVQANDIGTIDVANVDFDTDANNDPNFGSYNLFP